MSRIPIALVVAVARNGVIGVDNQLPWRLPGDLRHFKAVTMGKPVVMGRKTFESIGRALPGRHNIVVTRDPAFAAAGVEVVHSVEAALQAAQRAAESAQATEIAVIGGAEIYRQLLSVAEVIHLTRVELDVVGDAHFPMPDPAQWRCVESRPGRDDGVDYHLERYLRYRTLP
jgi:dihydrofolate reductase